MSDRPKKIIPVFSCIEGNTIEYLKALNCLEGFEFPVFESALDVVRHGKENPLCGVLVDLKTLMSASGSEKEQLGGLEDIIPILRLRRNAKTDEIAGLCRGHISNGLPEIIEFIKTKMNTPSTRTMRRHSRAPIYLNIEITQTGPQFDEPIYLANTTNVSDGGMFITTTHELDMTMPVFIRVVDSAEIEILSCQLRWKMSWGTTHQHLPGYGVSFGGVEDRQKALLLEFVRKTRVA